MNTFAKGDRVLQALCEAPTGDSGALFRDELGKQCMESCIRRAGRKLKAAEYHCANIDAEIQRSRELAEESVQRSGATQGGMALFGEKEEIAYELDAFLAAARGCIDFIAGAHPMITVTGSEGDPMNLLFLMTPRTTESISQ